MVNLIPDFKEDVICSRDENGRAVTNIPQRIICHSPDGFEWGYGGSGPADFALNILSVFIGQEAAQSGGIYQKFKWNVIVNVPQEGGVISREEILRWIDENMKENK